MKILITNNTLDTIGGSETHAYALIKQLDIKHNVTAYSKRLGDIANILKNDMIEVTNKLSNNFNEYDLILASHTSTIPDLVHHNCTIVQTCHGIFTTLEQPTSLADKHVAISHEVQEHLIQEEYDSKLILNGIDCERFKPTTKLSKQLKTILSLSHSKPLNNILQGICDNRGIKLITRDKYTNPVFNIENEINKADLVITLGRGVYESMACGRNVMILDNRHYTGLGLIGDGMVTDQNIDKFILNNCSGRYSNKRFTPKDIENELDKYNYIQGQYNRDFAIRELNIINQANKYLELI